MARISPGTMTAAIFAILIGLGGAYAVRQYLHQPVPEVEVEEAAAPVPIIVPVAARDVVVGQTVTLNDIAVHRMQPDEFKQSAYFGLSFMSNTQQINGRTLRTVIKKGEVFTATSFFADGMGPGIAESLKPGFRAVSIPIEDIAAVAGFARSGTMVDVIFRSIERDGFPETTMTLLEGVEVLALGNAIVPGQRAGSQRGGTTGKVTLAVTPAQAKALKVVEGRGALSLTLRNPNDVADEFISLSRIRSSARVTLDQLLGNRIRTQQMVIYRAGQKEVITFEDRLNDQFHETMINTPVAADIPVNGETPGITPMPLDPFRFSSSSERDAQTGS